MKINKNKPQLNSEIKLFEIDLEVVMERLSLLAGSERPTEIMRWMGVGSSTYTNWRRNGSVPYRTLVLTLLEKGISLDAFFAPKQRLTVPDELFLTEQPAEYSEDQQQRLVIRATLEAKKFLERSNLPEKEVFIKLFVDLWMLNEGLMFNDRRMEDILLAHFEVLDSNV